MIPLQFKTRFAAVFLAASAMAILVFGALTAADSKPGADKIDFTREVRPILANNCFACHGQDEKHRLAGLRLDVRGSATKPAGSGKIPIVPGKPASRYLIARLHY